MTPDGVTELVVASAEHDRQAWAFVLERRGLRQWSPGSELEMAIIAGHPPHLEGIHRGMAG
jgi:hypothetical protein